jgi:hypothetical protein
MVRRRRLFTLDEALEALPEVRRIMQQAQAYKDDLDKAATVLEALLVLTSGNGRLERDINKAHKEAERAAQALQGCLDELDGLGAELKGLEEGLVDFPCERDGRIVYLCWRFGEETISWWHELDTGFGGRQPLEKP